MSSVATTSADFPVAWEDPSDAELFWVRESLHHPGQSTALDESIMRLWFPGFGRAANRLGLPLHARIRRFNTYHYQVIGPLPLPPEEFAARIEAALPGLQALVLRLQAFWDEEVLPETRAHIAALEELAEHLDDPADAADAVAAVAARLPDLGTLHFSIDLPLILALSLYQDRYEALFGVEHGLEAHDLVAGLPSESIDPAIAPLARLAARRDAALAAARARLEGEPAEVRAAFEGLLASAGAATVLSNDHNLWLDQRTFGAVRRVIAGAAALLAARGGLEDPADVTHLELAELEAALRGTLDAAAVVAERKAELARFADVVPPPVLGTPPPHDPAAEANLFARVSERYYGRPPVQEDAEIVAGTAASRGTARGTARVLASPDEAHRLQPGDVLVARTTSTAWTPLFATAGAIVTDVGGVLGHTAVVAREFAIPAVTATGCATAAIRDGDTVEVDGDAGVVRVVR